MTTAASRPAATTVADVMTSNVVAAHADAQFKHIIEFLARNRISCVPVIDDHRRVLGVVSESDLLGYLTRTAPRIHRLSQPFRLWHPRGRAPVTVTATQLMTSPPVTVAAGESIAAAAHRAIAANVHRMPVVDEAGTLVGIVSRADLLKAYLRPDGDIVDQIVGQVIVEQLALDPAELRVTATAGVVRLAGQVSRPAVADQLVAAAGAVPGVVAIENQLSVKHEALSS